MRKPLEIIIKLSIITLLIGGAAYYFGFVNPRIWQSLMSRLFPCSQPITYSIGNFDTRFGISKADFLKDLAEAENIWEQPIGRQLFSHVEQGGALTINLVYDMRQESTIKLQRLGIIIHDDQASYDSLKAKFNTLSATYRQRKAALDASFATFESRKRKFEQEVARWNAKGGAPPPEYQRLKQAQNDLNELADKIHAEETSLNLLVETLNSMVAVLNRLAKTLNENIIDFNGTGLVGTGEFEEGEYVYDAGTNEINVYQFDDQTSLIRLLAHEVGHALGLPHVEDDQAIMYRLNSGANEKLTSDDLALLKSRCGIK